MMIFYLFSNYQFHDFSTWKPFQADHINKHCELFVFLVLLSSTESMNLLLKYIFCVLSAINLRIFQNAPYWETQIPNFAYRGESHNYWKWCTWLYEVCSYPNHLCPKMIAQIAILYSPLRHLLSLMCQPEVYWLSKQIILLFCGWQI